MDKSALALEANATALIVQVAATSCSWLWSTRFLQMGRFLFCLARPAHQAGPRQSPKDEQSANSCRLTQVAGRALLEDSQPEKGRCSASVALQERGLDRPLSHACRVEKGITHLGQDRKRAFDAL